MPEPVWVHRHPRPAGRGGDDLVDPARSQRSPVVHAKPQLRPLCLVVPGPYTQVPVHGPAGFITDVIGRDGQVQGIVAPRGVIEVDRAGLRAMVQDIGQARVGVDQPVTRGALTEPAELGFDPPGCPGQEAP
jgi:hypothetical protein